MLPRWTRQKGTLKPWMIPSVSVEDVLDLGLLDPKYRSTL